MRSLLLALLILLTACQTNPYGEVPKQLALKVRTFEDVVRWGALPKMYLFEKHDSDTPVTLPDNLDNVRVTSYELSGQLSQIEPNRWGQTAVIDYVLMDRQVVRQVIDRQIWETEDEGKTWYRVTPVPQFR